MNSRKVAIMLLAVSRLRGVDSITDDLNGLLTTILGISIVVSAGMIGLTTLFDQQVLAVTKSTLTVPHFGGHLGSEPLGLLISAQHLDEGEYLVLPPLSQIHAASSVAPRLLPVSWTTQRTGIFGGDEK